MSNPQSLLLLLAAYCLLLAGEALALALAMCSLVHAPVLRDMQSEVCAVLGQCRLQSVQQYLAK
jgi:hypothetical protein